jgi:aminodeoxyfutalosine deaminase
VQVSVTADLDRLIRALPKAELHVHLEGSLTPRTLLSLANRHRLENVPRTLEDLKRWYEFRNFAHFVQVYETAVHALRDPEDFAVLAAETGRSLAAQGVRYAEITWTPSIHLSRGIPADAVFAGYELGRREAERETGVRLRWILDFPGHYGTQAGHDTLDAALATDCAAVIGFGVGGLEVDRTPFAEVFARARAAGLHSVPHAGETSGPESVWVALDDLGAERVGHGITSVDDPTLLARLAADQIPLEVCPTSNLRTRAVGSLAEHPMRRLRDAGIPITVASDDPPMFNTTLVGEYHVAAQLLGLDAAGVAELARTSIRASFLPDTEQHPLLNEIDAVLTQHAK